MRASVDERRARRTATTFAACTRTCASGRRATATRAGSARCTRATCGRARSRRSPSGSGGQSYEERTLPVASVEDYFLHFPCWRSTLRTTGRCLEPSGKPSPGLFHPAELRRRRPPPTRGSCSRRRPRLSRAGCAARSTGASPTSRTRTFWTPRAFDPRFLEPAQQTLGAKLAGVIWSSPTSAPPKARRRTCSWTSGRGSSDAVPEAPYHIEVRSSHLLSPRYLDWLAERRGRLLL